MTRAARLAVVLCVAVAVLVGATLPASATFTASRSTAPIGVSTLTVQPPTNLTATCLSSTKVRLTWNLSDSPRVTSYRVQLSSNNGSTTIQTRSAPWTGGDFFVMAGVSYTFTVTAITDYRWTGVSGTVTVPPC
jgi:hypothetical protein